LRAKVSSQPFKKRMKELEKVSVRIEAKMAKLDRMISNISKSLG
jgi:hypothetical protein